MEQPEEDHAVVAIRGGWTIVDREYAHVLDALGARYKSTGYIAVRRPWDWLHWYVMRHDKPPFRIGVVIDHINGYSNDNRKRNLRYLSRVDNRWIGASHRIWLPSNQTIEHMPPIIPSSGIT